MNWEDGQKIKIKTSKALFGLVKDKFLISRKEDFVRETKYLSLHNNITGNFCFQKRIIKHIENGKDNYRAEMLKVPSTNDVT